MDGSSQLLNIHSKKLGDQVEKVARKFNTITYIHVYKEWDRDENKLSKEGHQVAEGKVVYEEIRDG
jgi:hypothetical protein